VPEAVDVRHRQSSIDGATTRAERKPTPIAVATTLNVTPAQATNDSSSKSPEQASEPLPPAFSCRPASKCAIPVSMRTEGRPVSSAPVARKQCAAASGCSL
jgi:hypothetical protein